MKWVIRICCCLIVLGLILAFAGGMLGGAQEARTRFNARHELTLDKGFDILDDITDYATDDMFDDTFDDMFDDTFDDVQSFPNSAVKEIELTLSGANFQLVMTDDNSLYYTVDATDTLYENYSVGLLDDNKWKATLRCAQTKDHPIFIYLPAGKTYEDCQIDLGAGTLKAEGTLSAEEFDIHVGAGQIQLALNRFSAADVKVGAGTAALSLEDTWSDYAYDFQCGAGSLRVNDKEMITGIGQNSRDTGIHELEIKVGMGTVDLYVAEDSTRVHHEEKH